MKYIMIFSILFSSTIFGSSAPESQVVTLPKASKILALWLGEYAKTCHSRCNAVANELEGKVLTQAQIDVIMHKHLQGSSGRYNNMISEATAKIFRKVLKMQKK
ncbi:MAG TPA: hypothetical protein VLG50_04850 [Candidatus Saccharimonadales bacterium]|nr:hypothetical protein [Candidatus Saccharimonadales bacterium]